MTETDAMAVDEAEMIVTEEVLMIYYYLSNRTRIKKERLGEDPASHTVVHMYGDRPLINKPLVRCQLSHLICLKK